MNINPLTGLYSGASSQLQKTASRIQTTIASLVAGTKTSVSEDVAGFAIAAQLQSQIGPLRQTAGNLTQALNQVQVAGDGVSRQAEIVDRLKQLATQANNGTLNADAREGLDIEFQQLVGELNRISGDTSFNGVNLLDGSFSSSVNQALGTGDSEEGTQLDVPDLSADALGLDGLDLLTQEGAQAALQALETAGDTLLSTQSDIGSFAQTLDFAAASIESALFNQEAARSELMDTDIAETSTELALLNVRRDAAFALQAQTNKLPPTLLDLINSII